MQNVKSLICVQCVVCVRVRVRVRVRSSEAQQARSASALELPDLSLEAVDGGHLRSEAYPSLAVSSSSSRASSRSDFMAMREGKGGVVLVWRVVAAAWLESSSSHLVKFHLHGSSSSIEAL